MHKSRNFYMKIEVFGFHIKSTIPTNYIIVLYTMATFSHYQTSKCDDFMTPLYIWTEVAEFIPKDKKLWLPFYGDGQAEQHLRSLAFKDIVHQDKDFFTYDVENSIVIDNPPYAAKKEVMERLVELDRPFMLLMPLATLSYGYSQKLGVDFQLIFHPKRPKFIKYSPETGEHDDKWSSKNPTQPCCWNVTK